MAKRKSNKSENKTEVKNCPDSPLVLANILSEGFIKMPAHLQAIDNELKALENRDKRRLIVNMPPRHGKSELISKYFPFWYLLRQPGHNMILSSYSEAFAITWGLAVKDLIVEHGQDYGLELRPDIKAGKRFALTNNATMTCVGARGSLTGRGADLLIIDDPIKNDAEANSKHQRNMLWDWFNATAFTRLSPIGILVIVMTRWHEDDLCGRLLDSKSFKEKWHLLKLKAIAEDHDPLGRTEGEALWDEQFPATALTDIREQIGQYWFASLYQQSPAPAEGGLFKRSAFRYFTSENEIFILKTKYGEQTIPARECSFYATIDLATRLSEKSDYTVLMHFAVSPSNDVLLLNVIRQKISPGEHEEMIVKFYNENTPDLIGIESVQYQVVLVQTLLNRGIPVIELKPDRDKYTRALGIAALCENEKVFFRRNAHWIDNLESELLDFPNGTHDDQTDAFAYIIKMMNFANTSVPVSRRKHSK